MLQLVLLQKSDACTIADKFLSMLVNQHGLLEHIMSNCDPCFCGHYWGELMSLLDMALIFSMVSHPQTDRIAEVTNHTME